MDILIYAMIYAGSALMVYNIVRYYGFTKRMSQMAAWDGPRGVLLVPLILLVLFLIGYLAVGILGDPDMVIAGILFGGSIYVAIVLGVMYRIFDRVRSANERSNAQYAEIRESLENLAKDYLSVFRVNLTKDIIEERTGTDLHEGDVQAVSYSAMMKSRRDRLLSRPGEQGGEKLFTREGLLSCFESGRTYVEERLYCRMVDGRSCFVKLEATLAVQPDTGDVVAFVTETNCNDEMVNDVLLSKALGEQYDMITYLADGRYGVVIGEEGPGKKGSVFPKAEQGDYARYLDEQIAPVLCGTEEEKAQVLESLSLSRISAELENREPYEVNIAVNVDGGVYYKRFVYFIVDPEVKFYVLLKSDTTKVRLEEAERSNKLREALEEAQRASKAKTTFLSNMSHDIRTPMNAIVGYTEFARKSDDIEQAHEYLDKIDASNQYMLALIDDVLEMSRIESGKMEIVPEPTDLVHLMEEVESLFETQMGEKGIDYTVDAASVRDRYALCDRTRLNRVLLNLVSNAYKFTPEKGTVSVTLVEREDSREGWGSYELRVKDSGIGMTEEFAERVFDAFERERNTTASGIQGTGLGMAITKNIVDMMGGTIEVVTEQGSGTEFVIDLDFELCESADVDSMAPGADVLPADAVDFGGKRILLAEDNEINREIATMIFEEMGFAVDEAHDGKQAVDMLVEGGPGRYDVVVTDIQMPVMDGYEEVRVIRALEEPALANVPIIAMSANAFQEDIQASKEVGIDEHVAKPIDIDAVTAALVRVLS